MQKHVDTVEEEARDMVRNGKQPLTPLFVDLKDLAFLCRSDKKRTREMVAFLQGQGFEIRVVPWGAKKLKYNLPQFIRALYDFAESMASTI